MIEPQHLISPRYRDEQRRLHAQPHGYGGKGDKWAPVVQELIRSFEATSVLDYGCGQGALVRALSVDRPAWLRLAEYDPAIPGKDGLPSFADLVVCTDVLEHVETVEILGTVLTHLRQLARKAVLLVVATRPSNKTLADGRNAHLLQHEEAWWRAQVLAAGFTLSGHAVPHPIRKPSREWAAVVLP